MDYSARMQKMGNTVNVLLHMHLAPDFELCSVAQPDALRDAGKRALGGMENRFVADLAFVVDMSPAD